jgi:S1-C subfamily serine protease
MFFSHWWFRLTQGALYRKTAATTIGLSVRYPGGRKSRKHPARASGFLLDCGVVCTARHVVENAQWIYVHPKGGGMMSVNLDKVIVVPELDIAFIVVPDLIGSPANAATPDDLSADDTVLMLRTPLGITSIWRSEAPVHGRLMGTNMAVGDFVYDHTWVFTQHSNLMVTDHETIPGDSGSALYDGQGNVLGMVIQRVTAARPKHLPHEPLRHLTFAIPMADILTAARDRGLV